MNRWFANVGAFSPWVRSRGALIRWGIVGVAVLAVAGNVLVGRPASPAPPASDATIETYLAGQLADAGIPGAAVAIVRDGGVSDLHGFGTADAHGRPITGQTPFVIGSLAKSITAMAVLQLVDAGQVTLDTPVRQYLPDFQLADPALAGAVTVRELLGQTSGIPTSAGVLPLARPVSSLADQVAALADVEPTTAPGATFQYSNANYEVLGLLVERVSGEPFARYIEAHVFAPLAMTHASLDLATAQENGLTMAHRLWFGLAPVSAPIWRPDFAPAGWMSASAEDMAHFLVAQLGAGTYVGRQIVSSAAVAEMHAGVAPMGPGDPGRYGLGWVDTTIGSTRVIAHAGSTTDMASVELLAPDRHLGMVVLVNGQSTLYELFHKLDSVGFAAFALALGEPMPGTLSLFYPAFDGLALALIVWTLWALAHAAGALRAGRAPRLYWLGSARLGLLRTAWLSLLAPVAILLNAPALFGAAWPSLVRIDVGLVLLGFALLRLVIGGVLVGAWARSRAGLRPATVGATGALR